MAEEKDPQPVFDIDLEPWIVDTVKTTPRLEITVVRQERSSDGN